MEHDDSSTDKLFKFVETLLLSSGGGGGGDATHLPTIDELLQVALAFPLQRHPARRFVQQLLGMFDRLEQTEAYNESRLDELVLRASHEQTDPAVAAALYDYVISLLSQRESLSSLELLMFLPLHCLTQ